MAFSQVNETEEIHSLKIINGDFCNTGGSVFVFEDFIFCNTGEQRWDYELAHVLLGMISIVDNIKCFLCIVV